MKELKLRHKELLDTLTERLADVLLGEKLPLDICEAQHGEIIIPCNHKISKTMLHRCAKEWRHLEIDPSPIRNRILSIVFQFENQLEEVELAISKMS